MRKYVLILGLILFLGCGKEDLQGNLEGDLANLNKAPLISNQSFDVLENSDNGTSIGFVTAEDPEGDSLSYFLEGSKDGISIKVRTGELIVLDPKLIDFESLRTITLTVIVQDSNSRTSATVTLNVLDEEDGVLTNIQKDFLNEYYYVTFNLSPTSFGAAVNEKWRKELKLFLDGDITDNYRSEVLAALEEFNSLFSDGFKITLAGSVEDSNVHVYRGAKSEIREIFPSLYEAAILGNFHGYAQFYNDAEYNIDYGQFWVTKDSGMAIFKHELGHVIGLGHASEEYCGNIANRSLMCSGPAMEFSQFDQGVIRVLYSPTVVSAQTYQELRPIIEQLLIDDFVSLDDS